MFLPHILAENGLISKGNVPASTVAVNSFTGQVFHYIPSPLETHQKNRVKVRPIHH